MAEDAKYIYYRSFFEPDLKNLPIGTEYKNTTLFDLMSALKKALDRTKRKEPEHVIEINPHTIEEVSETLIKALSKKHRLTFFNFVYGKSKFFIVVAFLSLLELLKLQRIFITQSENFDDIVIGINPSLN